MAGFRYADQEAQREGKKQQGLWKAGGGSGERWTHDRSGEGCAEGEADIAGGGD